MLTSKKVYEQNYLCPSHRCPFLIVMLGAENAGSSLTFLYLTLLSVLRKKVHTVFVMKIESLGTKQKNIPFQNTENFFLIQLRILTRCLMSKCLLLIQLISQMLYFQPLLQTILKLGFMERLLIMIINFKSALVMGFSPVAHHPGSSISGKTEAVIKSTKSFRISAKSNLGLMGINADSCRNT